MSVCVGGGGEREREWLRARACVYTATKTFLNCDSIPQSINLEGSDIKLPNTVRNLYVSLDPTLSVQQQISSISRIPEYAI